MTDYCHLTNGVIDEGRKPLPTAWRNISGINHMDAAGLKEIGWLPVRYVGADFDSATQVRTGPVGAGVGDTVPADADEVVGTYTVRDKTAQELDAEKDEIARQITERDAFKAYVLAVNDGSIVPGANMTPAQLKAAVKAHL